MRQRIRENINPGSVQTGWGDIDLAVPWGDGPWDFVGNNIIDVSSKASSCEVTWDELHPGPPYRSGGPFDCRKITTNQFELRNVAEYYGWKYRYTGGFIPGYYPTDYLDWDSPYSSVLDDDHWIDPNFTERSASDWNRFRPAKPKADMGQFLGEIREIPRMLRTSAKGFHDVWRSYGGSLTEFAPKTVANHWLNTQFGWLPFIRDLQSFYYATKDLEKQMYQLSRDNNQWIKRGGTTCTDSNTEILINGTVSTAHRPLLPSYYHNFPLGSIKLTRVTTLRIWFTARYKYWIRKLESSPWGTEKWARVYGLRVSPSLVWNLTPWTWLIDWCSNAGDVIDNVSAILLDELCAKYAYSMATREQRVITESTSNTKTQGVVFGSWEAKASQKIRREASPFGFGLTALDFTNRQWSILAALGLTRLR